MAVPAGHLRAWCSVAVAQWPHVQDIGHVKARRSKVHTYRAISSCLRLGDAPATRDKPSGCLFAPAHLGRSGHLIAP